jgi:hypothetical protein
MVQSSGSYPFTLATLKPKKQGFVWKKAIKIKKESGITAHCTETKTILNRLFSQYLTQ